MNQKNQMKAMYVVWAVVLSGIIMGSFLFLLQGGKSVLAQQPVEVNVTEELTSVPRIAVDNPEQVTAVLASKRDILAEGIPQTSFSTKSASVGQIDGSFADVLSPLTSPIPGSADLVVSMDSDRVWGIVGAGQTVTVTVNSAQVGAAMADNNGFFWTTLYNSSGSKPDLDGGEVIHIYSDGSLLASTTLRTITVEIEVNDDDVQGNISDASSLPVAVYPGWNQPNMTTYSQTTTTDGSGDFALDFNGKWDFVADDSAQVVYTENSIEVHQRAYSNRFVVQPWPGNSVFGNAEPGTAITVTVYESDGVTLKQQEFINASDDESGAYSISDLNIVRGDIVTVEIEGSETMSRKINALELYIDAENDRITGVTKSNANIACRTSPLLENGRALLSVETTADATGMYTVELAGTSDIMPGYWNGCYVHDAEGDDLNLWEPAYGLVVVNQSYDEVYGRAVAPRGPLAEGRLVTLTIYSQSSDSTSTFSKGMGWAGIYSFNVDEDGLPDIQPGDTITVESEGNSWQGIVDVGDISVQHDVENDRFTGDVNPPSNRVEVSGAYWYQLSSWNLFPVGGEFATAVTANSPFAAETSGFDVRNGVEYYVVHRTADELSNEIYVKTDNVRLWSQFNSLSGVTFPPAGTGYTVTLYDGGGSQKAEFTGQSGGPYGDVDWLNFWDQGEEMQPGDYLEIGSSAGLSQTLHVPDDISVIFDGDAEEITGNGPANTLLFIDVTDQGRGFVPTDNNGDFSIDVNQLQQFDGDGDFQEGQDVMICYLVLEGSQICYLYSWPAIRIDVNYAHQWFELQTVPNETVYVTLTDSGGSVKAAISGDSDGGGWFRSHEWNDQWNPEQPSIQPGDRLTATAAGLVGAINPIGEIYGEIDLDNDIVSGTLNAPWFSPVTLTVSCEVWVEFGVGFEIAGVDPDNGEFICDYGANGWDLQAEHDVALRYIEPDNDAVINVFRSPWVRVNYGHDWVAGDYPAGHTFWITQTQGGIGQAFATVDSEAGRGWNGDGFETEDQSWTPARPDLQVGDVILFTSDDGYSNSVTVGDITGNLDIDADYISGTVNASWFEPTPLHLICEYWDDPHTRFDLEVDPVNGEYECDFAGEVDILKGRTVAVMYVEPDDGDYIINTFEEPAPDVEVQKWTEGDPAAGGRLIYWIEYWNHGNGEAYSTTMTDTLPGSTTYVVDDSPFSVMTTVSEVIWDLGTLAPHSNGRFKMVVDIDQGATGWLDNHIEITTLDDNNPDNNHSDHSIEIQSTDVDLSIGKWIHYSNPAPGYNFKYRIQYNNEGSTGSGQVTVTDTLPVPTSYVSFFSQDALWYLESYDGVNVVFIHPGLSGFSGDQIELTLHLSDTIIVNDPITNTAQIAATNETGTGDNNTAEHVTYVRDPHMNLSLDKRFAYGTIVAGYDVTFGINYNNNDNVPANNVFITDTIPSGTTFVTSTKEVWTGNNWEQIPFPPDSVSGDKVVWEMGTLDVASDGQIYITLNIDTSVTEGTVLTNKAEIGSAGPNDYDEDYIDDNESTASITVRGSGANLMVIKRDRSNWEGDPQLTIRYDFQVFNLGTVPVSNLRVVDTYPDVTTFNYADLWWGGDITFQHNPSLNRAMWIVNETLWPGENFGGHVTVDLDPNENRGSIFTNTIIIRPTIGDIYPQDNTDYEVLTTGPDLYVTKMADSPWVEAGELVTFTLRFGNNARRGEDWTQGTTLLTDTLPAGMTYVTSTLQWYGGPGCPYITPDIVGDKLVFDMGQMGEGSWNEIFLTVMVDSQAKGGDTFGNFVEYQSATPADDPEGDYSNNTDSFTMAIEQTFIFLPIVVRNK